MTVRALVKSVVDSVGVEGMLDESLDESVLYWKESLESRASFDAEKPGRRGDSRYNTRRQFDKPFYS